jgi:hypothetical protein
MPEEPSSEIDRHHHRHHEKLGSLRKLDSNSLVNWLQIVFYVEKLAKRNIKFSLISPSYKHTVPAVSEWVPWWKHGSKVFVYVFAEIFLCLCAGMKRVFFLHSTHRANKIFCCELCRAFQIALHCSYLRT